jgi:hypothetical protein
MDTQRIAALLIFVGIVLVGLVALAVVRSMVKHRRLERESEELEAFLNELSDGDDENELTGAPAVMFKEESESNYSEEPARKASIFITTGDYPNSEEMRKIVERNSLLQRRRILHEMVRKKLQTMARGAVVVEEGAPLLVRNLKVEGLTAKADLYRSGERAGVMELSSRDGEVISGKIQLNEEGKRVVYEVMIAMNHPNASRLYASVDAVRPLDPSTALRTVKASYNATAKVAIIP